MQKILRINILARNNAAKAARLKQKQTLKKEWRDFDKGQVLANRATSSQIRAERKARREDWMKGDLAPDRNVGTVRGSYGSVEQAQVRGRSLPSDAKRGPKSDGWDIVGREGLPNEHKEWEGEGQEGNIVVGDRVCVVRGRDGVRGKIGVVKEIRSEEGELTVDGLNVADIQVPSWAQQTGQARSKYITSELPFQFDDVRLVYRMSDESTGIDRDVIIRHLRGGAPYFQREYGSNIPRHTRYIAGEEIEIPWPNPEIAELSREEADTTRQQVEEMSFMPSVIESPLPSGAIDEIRSKYSKGRVWHDTGYVAQKVIEDARSAWYESRSLQSPLQESRLAENARVAAQREVQLDQGPSPETLDIIAQMQADSIQKSEKA